MNFQKISKLQDAIKQKKEKLNKEKDTRKKQILKYRIEIDEIKDKIERLKNI
jgi:hypothetical protein